MLQVPIEDVGIRCDWEVSTVGLVQCTTLPARISCKNPVNLWLSLSLSFSPAVAMSQRESGLCR